MRKRRRRVQHSQPLEQRLTQEAHDLREAANALPLCAEREALLRKARQNETASHIAEWLSSPGLRAPA
ncbi:hypothetical protein L6639_36935 [Bradyrhizobium sp. WYCCWR 12678]|nr:hypothetical protein [Bradyrhizobium zhengyangense]MCG2644785.1 hypothetical protein [Bradyrhizobium zhengyangense]